MKFNYQDNSLKAGIYKLISKINNRIYVGSTYQFKRRWYQHKYELEKGIHSNTFLQNDFNKCGTDAFVFEVLDVIDSGKEDRLFVEQVYLDYYFDYMNQCYNLNKLAKITDHSITTKRKISQSNNGKTHSEKTKKILSQKHTGKTLSEETKKKIGIANKGKILSLKTKNKISETHKGENNYLYNKTLEEIHGEEKARDIKNKMSKSHKDIHNGEKNHRFGKHHTEEHKQKLREINTGRIHTEESLQKMRKGRKIFTNFNLKSPDGLIYNQIMDLKEFCKNNNLNYKCMWAVIKGKKNSHKNWKLLNDTWETLQNQNMS